MKITAIDTFVVDAGWRPWTFVALRTDEGLTGYGECSDGRNPFGVVATIGEFETIMKGRDPRHVEMNYQDMYRMSRQSPGGIAAKAIAGIELAMWDVKAKALGVPVPRTVRRAAAGPPAGLLVALRLLAGAALSRTGSGAGRVVGVDHQAGPGGA